MRITPLPPLHCLVAFEAVARHRSFTLAARELHLTQGAISRQVAHLEAFLGRALFLREHRTIRLTTAGERYADGIQQLLAQCAASTREIMKHRGRFELTIACSSGVALTWLTPRLAAFRAAHPQVDLRIVVRDGLATLSPAEFDVGLYYLRQPAASAFATRRLYDEDVFPVCAPDYLDGVRVAPRELLAHTLLNLEDGQRQWMSWADWFGYQGIALAHAPRALVINHYPQLLQLAILGQGIVLAWRHMIDPCLDAGLLVRATHESASHGGGYCLVTPNDRAESPAARLFAAWALDQAGAAAAS